VTPLYPQKLAVTSPTGGGRSVGIVRSRTKATESQSNKMAPVTSKCVSSYKYVELICVVMMAEKFGPSVYDRGWVTLA